MIGKKNTSTLYLKRWQRLLSLEIAERQHARRFLEDAAPLAVGMLDAGTSIPGQKGIQRKSIAFYLNIVRFCKPVKAKCQSRAQAFSRI